MKTLTSLFAATALLCVSLSATSAFAQTCVYGQGGQGCADVQTAIDNGQQPFHAQQGGAVGYNGPVIFYPKDNGYKQQQPAPTYPAPYDPYAPSYPAAPYDPYAPSYPAAPYDPYAPSYPTAPYDPYAPAYR